MAAAPRPDSRGHPQRAARQPARDPLRTVADGSRAAGRGTRAERAHYSLDNPEDTDLTVYALPFHVTKPVWGDDRPKLHLEGAIGYAEARESVADLYGGTLPGLATEVRTRWRTYGALLGAGIEIPVAEGWTATPILDVGLSRIENDTNYAGPGAAATAALADGIAFNWDAMAFTYGGAGRVDWRRSLDEHHKLGSSRGTTCAGRRPSPRTTMPRTSSPARS